MTTYACPREKSVHHQKCSVQITFQYSDIMKQASMGRANKRIEPRNERLFTEGLCFKCERAREEKRRKGREVVSRRKTERERDSACV